MKPLKVHSSDAYPCVREIYRMAKPLGYCAFEGWGSRNFFFFDRDKKNTVVSVKMLPEYGK